MTETRRIGLVTATLLVCLAALFPRMVMRGEVFSPADLVFSYPPWSYGSARSATTNITRSDEAVYHQPLMITHWKRLRAFEWPEWDPLLLGGTPAFFQGLNTGLAASPFSLPFYLLPPDIAVSVAAPMRLFAAGLFMWVFLRRLALSPMAAAAGTVAFALNGAFIVWLSAPMPSIALFLPLMLLLVDRTVGARDDAARSGPAALLALTIGVAFWGAYLPTSLVVCSTAAAYAAWLMAATRHWRAAVPVAAAFVGGLAVGGVALVPMFGNLLTSPASRRAVAHLHLPAANLATFAMPDFWGNPVDHNWWYPGSGNYPEFVTYLGIVPLLLAGARLAAFGTREGRHAAFVTHPRALFFAISSTAALLYMYGVPPLSWLGQLPGFRQTNPYRFNVVLAFSVAALAAFGVDVLKKGPRLALIGPIAAVALLAGGVGVGLAAHLTDIRALGLQEYEKAQLLRFAALAVATIVCCHPFGWLRRWPRHAETWQRIGGVMTIVLMAVDLIGALWRFNPTLPRDRMYPTTPALEFLRTEAAGSRVVPVGDGRDLLQGHTWSVYGLETVTGFDFYGDAPYQEWLARAQGRSFEGPQWSYVGVDRVDSLDMRLLGLMNARFLFTSPEVVATRIGGFAAAGDLTTGRSLRQRFTCPQNGLRRIDVLTATFGRLNDGELRLAFRERNGVTPVAERRVRAEDVPNNAWLSLELPPQAASRRREYEFEITAIRGEAGRSVTALITQADDPDAGMLEIDGKPTNVDLWFRAFASAPDRWNGATAVYAGDLNVYRNDHATPRAWFVSNIETLPREKHLARLMDPAFNQASTAVIDEASRRMLTGPHSARPGSGDATPRVESIEAPNGDTRRIRVHAATDATLIVSERWHRGWRAAVDGRAVPLMLANHLLIAVPVGAGAREITLNFKVPYLRGSIVLSITAGLVCIVLASRGSRARPL